MFSIQQNYTHIVDYHSYFAVNVEKCGGQKFNQLFEGSIYVKAKGVCLKKEEEEEENQTNKNLLKTIIIL